MPHLLNLEEELRGRDAGFSHEDIALGAQSQASKLHTAEGRRRPALDAGGNRRVDETGREGVRAADGAVERCGDLGDAPKLAEGGREGADRCRVGVAAASTLEEDG